MAIKTLGKKYRNESAAIRALKGELAKLEQKQKARDLTKLKQLPKQSGFSSVDELIENLAELASPALKGRVLGGGGAARKGTARKKKRAAKKGAAKKAASKKRAAKKGAARKRTAKKGATKKAASRKTAGKKVARAKKSAGKRSRAQVTAETIEKMKEAFAAKTPGPKIAKEFGVSPSTVHNIKKKLGLVKA